MATGNPVDSLRVHSLFPQCIGFALLLVTVAAISSWLIVPLLPPLQHFTIAFTKAVGSMLGMTMTSSDDIISINGFPLRIAGECTALNYILILTLAILLYARHSLLYRISGIAVATVILLIANAIRIISIGLLGPISLNLAQFVHQYVWVALFALLVFTMWKVWTDKKFRISGETLKRLGLSAVICTVTFLMLDRFKETYCHVLAILATPLFKLFSAHSQASIAWDGVLTFRQGQDTLQAGLALDIITLAIYVGALSPCLWHNRKAVPYALIGLATLITSYVVGIALLGVIGMNYGYAISQTFVFTGSVIFMSFPLVMYWMITGLQKREC
ncbi:MAG: archaeosortase/exosortase family protein [Oryzomonas sp.]|jgi:exosortase/archaeosortase family protein